MVLRAGIKIGFRALHGRHYALVLPPQFPPRFVVLLRLHLVRKYFPAPLVHQQPKRQEGYFLQRLLQQIVNIAGRRRHGVNQTDLLEVFGRDGKRDRISHCLVKAVVGAVLEKRRLPIVRALVEVVPQLVMDHPEILFRDLNAHLDPQIVLRIDVPGTGMTDDIAVRRLGEKRSLPEGLRQRSEPQGDEKCLAVTRHSLDIRASVLQDLCQVVALRRLWRIHQ